jgi:LPS export ABC transporter protein LptC
MKKYLMCVAMLLPIIVFAGCERESTVSILTEAQENAPDQEFVDSRIVITQQGRTNAIVQADSIRVFQSRNYTTIDGSMVVDFFDAAGTQKSTLTADHGEIWGLYENVDSLRAFEKVEVVAADSSKRLNTDSAMTWSGETRNIYSDGPVTLVTNDAVEQGVNFVAKDDLSEYTMNSVSGAYQGALPKPK